MVTNYATTGQSDLAKAAQNDPWTVKLSWATHILIDRQTDTAHIGNDTLRLMHSMQPNNQQQKQKCSHISSNIASISDQTKPKFVFSFIFGAKNDEFWRFRPFSFWVETVFCVFIYFSFSTKNLINGSENRSENIWISLIRVATVNQFKASRPTIILLPVSLMVILYSNLAGM